MSNANENIEEYNKYKAEIDKRELANSDNYDKNILTLSSAGLVTSLTLIKDISSSPIWIIFLYTSWVLFGLSIILTISSFLLSNFALRMQLKIAEDYYINGNDDAFNKTNYLGKSTAWVNLSSGLAFSLAVASVIVFGTLNFNGISMFGTPTEKTEHQQMKPSNQTPKDVEKGATVPPLIKKPQPQPPKNNP